MANKHGAISFGYLVGVLQFWLNTGAASTRGGGLAVVPMALDES